VGATGGGELLCALTDALVGAVAPAPSRTSTWPAGT